MKQTTKVNPASRLVQCFSTRVLPVVSKGSVGPPVFSKKLMCLQPLDTFSRLLVGPECICGPVWEAYSAPPKPLAGREGALPAPQQPLPRSRPLALNFSPSGHRSSIPKDTKIGAKGSASQKRLKNTRLMTTELQWQVTVATLANKPFKYADCWSDSAAAATDVFPWRPLATWDVGRRAEHEAEKYTQFVNKHKHSAFL